MRIFLAFIVVQFLLTGCSAVATGGAEITGLSLWHDRRTSKAIAEDERIEITAAIELNSQNSIRYECHYNVTAYNRTVLVTGEAPNKKLKDKIISVVRVIPGVKLVHNELRNAQPSTIASRSKDSIITTKVKTALTKIKSLPGFDATRVKVVTEAGVVYLLGLVHEKEGHITAEIARRKKGVKKVIKMFEYIRK